MTTTSSSDPGPGEERIGEIYTINIRARDDQESVQILSEAVALDKRELLSCFGLHYVHPALQPLRNRLGSEALERELIRLADLRPDLGLLHCNFCINGADPVRGLAVRAGCVEQLPGAIRQLQPV